MDAIARAEGDTPAGVRTHPLDYHELLADTPELVGRTEGPLTDGSETARLLGGILTEALAYAFDEDSELRARRKRHHPREAIRPRLRLLDEGPLRAGLAPPSDRPPNAYGPAVPLRRLMS